MLGNWAHEGLQPPSNLEERKGFKEAQYAAHIHSTAHPSPLGPAGRSPPRSRAPRRGPRPCPASPPRSREASLPSGSGSSPPRSRPPLDGKNERPFRSPARRTEALNANHSSNSARVRRRQAAIPHSGRDRSPVRQLRSLLRHPRPCADIPGTALATVLPTPCTPFVLTLRQNSR